MSKVNIVCANYDLLLNRCKLGIETLWGACVEGYNCPKYKAEMPSEIEEMALELCYPRSRIKAMHQRTCSNCDKSACDLYELCVDLYNAGYRKQSGWISVDERLPEREGTYLVYTYKGAIKFGDFRCYYAKNDNPQFDYYVTHWMPLPEAPKGGAE